MTGTTSANTTAPTVSSLVLYKALDEARTATAEQLSSELAALLPILQEAHQAGLTDISDVLSGWFADTVNAMVIPGGGADWNVLRQGLAERHAELLKQTEIALPIGDAGKPVKASGGQLAGLLELDLTTYAAECWEAITPSLVASIRKAH